MPGFAWRLEGNYARHAAARTPDYVLGNTGTEEWNAGATVGWRAGNTSLDASFHRYDFRGGVCYCVKNSTPADFVGQLDAPRPVGADAWTPTIAIDRPFQAVTHDVALARGEFAFLVLASVFACMYVLFYWLLVVFIRERGFTAGNPLVPGVMRCIRNKPFMILLATYAISSVSDYGYQR